MIKTVSLSGSLETEDRRTKYTKIVLTQSLLELMQEKEISRITVTEICRKADINRNTFYKYYYGPENLLSTIEDTFIEIITSSLSKMGDFHTMSQDLLRIILDNKELSRVIFSENGNQDFLRKILHLTRKKFLQARVQQVKPAGAAIVETMYLFSEGGTIAVITNWVRNDFKEDINEIASFIKLANTLIENEISNYS